MPVANYSSAFPAYSKQTSCVNIFLFFVKTNFVFWVAVSIIEYKTGIGEKKRFIFNKLKVCQLFCLHFAYISLWLSRMGHPTKIVFLDSDGTPAFEYRVPKGDSDMVRIENHLLTSCYMCVSAPGQKGKLSTGVMSTHPATSSLITHSAIINNKHTCWQPNTHAVTLLLCSIAHF